MKKVVLTAAVAALTLNSAAFAASVTGTANVNIIAALTITEATEIDFGNIAAVDGTCTMDAAGTLTGSNADLNCTGTATTASFDLAGAATEAVDISVTAGAAVGGVTYNPTIAGGATSVLLDGAGDASITVHGSIDLVSATTGAKTIPYTFTANYQ